MTHELEEEIKLTLDEVVKNTTLETIDMVIGLAEEMAKKFPANLSGPQTLMCFADVLRKTNQVMREKLNDQLQNDSQKASGSSKILH